MKTKNLVTAIRSLVLTAGLSAATMGDALGDPVYGWTNFVGQPGESGNADGAGTAARFWGPCGLVVAGSGDVYVTDLNNHTIRKATWMGEVTTLAGLAGRDGRTDGAGSTAQFRYPHHAAVDATGSIYVADFGNHTIRRVTAMGEVTTLAGRAGDTGSRDGIGSAARFYEPDGVTVDGAGTVYVSDFRNHTFRKVTATGVVTTLAGRAGQPGSADGIGSAARFYYPSGSAADSTGSMFVADSGNHTIRKLTAAGEVTTLAGSPGSQGGADGAGGMARFFQPYGLATDSAGNVYVADSYNNTIRKVSPEGVVTTIGGVALVSGWAAGVGSAARFSFPHDISVDRAGSVYVADSVNHRITKGVPIFPPVITAQPVGVTNNVGTNATFSVTVTGTEPLSYQWRLDETNLLGATGASLTLTNVQAADAGNYSVLATNLAGSTVSSNALLTVNLPPTVSISSPTNGSVMLAPATFTLIADARDDLVVAQVEFWLGTHSLGTVTNAPWYVVQTNLPPGEYDYTAVAVDSMGLASTSSVSPVTVLSQPPTTALVLDTSSVMVRQTGLFYQTVRIGNPTAAPLAGLRVWVELDANSIARGVQIWNATGQSNGVPYLSYNLSQAPGETVDLQVEYYVPDRQTLPGPVFRTAIVAPDPPLEPAGVVLSSTRQLSLTSGLFLVEFSTGAGQRYYIQYSRDMTSWKTASPAVTGTGSRVQWIDSGPPKTESASSSATSRFYRVLQSP